MHHMLTTAKADLEPDRFAAEHRVRVQHSALWIVVPTHRAGRERGEVLLKIILLGLLEVVALEAAIKIAAGSNWRFHARDVAGMARRCNARNPDAVMHKSLMTCQVKHPNDPPSGDTR